MSIDLERVRADTPGVEHRIHLNNAGSALMSRQVLQAMHDYLDLEARIGGYEAADQQADSLSRLYNSVAELIGSSREEIAIVENATVAWDLAFYSLQFAPGDRILTARAEYAANYVAYLQVAKRTGAVIEVIPDDAFGAIDPRALEAMLDERVKLISITWIPTNGGLVNPAAAVGEVARRHRIPYLLDACQAVGQIPVDVESLGCDMLSATGRKFLRGPRGTGFLYVRKSLLETLEPPMIDHFAAPWVSPGEYKLRDDARRFENWENNYAGRMGLGVACRYALEFGLDAIQARSFALADRLRDHLAALTSATVYDLGDRPGAIVSFALDNVSSETAKKRFAEADINVSLSDAESTLLDARARKLPLLLRASPHYYNTEEEVDRFAEVLNALA